MSLLEIPTIPAKAVSADIDIPHIVMSFKQGANNLPPCPKCHAADHGIRVHRYYIRQPCRCCGARDHSAFNTQLNENNVVTTIITCPIIELSPTKDLSEQTALNSVRYGVNENKSAEYCGYDIDTTIHALEDFISPTEDLSQQIALNFIRYGINGNKFAEYCGYDMDSTIHALEDFSTKGDGRHMTPHQLSRFKQNVIQICEEERNGWRFKRTPIGDDSNDILDL
jgi:hypothetical protein